MREIEALIVCRACGVTKATVYRIQAGNEGVYEHQTDPADFKETLCSVCGAHLERKNG